MSKNFATAAAFAIAMSAGTPVYSQENSTTADSSKARQLDEVVVTATRFEQKQSTTGKVVTVIDQKMLQRSAGRNLTEIINYQAGVFINGANNNLGSNVEIYLRGAGHGKSLILIDGIPVNDPSLTNNGFDLNLIPVSQVEKIEILKGAQSTLWGSDAIAGVINIITKKGASKKIASELQLSYGSYDTWRANAGINGKLDKFNYNVGYNYIKSAGFSSAQDTSGKANFDKDGFEQHSIQANLGYILSDRFSLKSLHSYSQYTNDIDAGAFRDDRDNVAENKNLLNNVELSYQSKGLRLNLSQSIQRTERIYTDDSAHVGGFAKYAKGRYEGNSYVTELYGNIKLAKAWSLVSGVQYSRANTEQNYLSISDFGPFETALGDSAKASNLSIYNSVQFNKGGFNLEVGFRYNDHNIYGNNSTYTFNPSYNIDENFRVFVNISSAYKVPTLYQLYSEYGNRMLKPEESRNYEIGFQTFSNDRSNSLRLVGFKRDIKNLIVFYTDPSTWASQYLNRDEQHDFGFEIESNTAIGKFGNWINNFTYVDGEGENGSVKVKNLYRRPNFTVNSTLDLTVCKKISLMPSFRFIGNRLKGEYDPGPSNLPSYYNIDLYVGYNFNSKLKTFIDLRNLTNQEYFDVPGYNNRKFNMTAGVSYKL